MRKKSTDNYADFALLGNNVYDMIFMKYLFLSQNVNSSYCDKYRGDHKSKEGILKNIAYYFGTSGPLLVDNSGLKKMFESAGIPRVSILPDLSTEDIINQIDACLKSDAVYVCNSSGELDKCTMFLLGYLMAMKQEIFFWNDIEESEWLMSCIAKKNSNGYKEVVQFPLEIIRTFAYPYLCKNINSNLQPGKYGEVIVTEEGNIGVERNIEFNLDIESQEEKKHTVCLLGSLRKQINCIRETALELSNSGYKVLAPKISNIKTDNNGFVIFEDDVSDNPIVIESDFIENCLSSEKIIVCDKDGYVGNTVMFEIGYLLAQNKKIEFIEEPKEVWVKEVVDYFSKSDDKKVLLKCEKH